MFLALLGQSVAHAQAPQYYRVGDCRTLALRQGSTLSVKVLDVADGDTIAVAFKGLKYKVRFLSVDTPETSFMANGEKQSQGVFGETAKSFVKSVLSSPGPVTLLFDRTPCDLYGRMLAYVFKGKFEINFELLKRGLAVNFCVYPTTERCHVYREATYKAFSSKLGIFSIVPKKTDPRTWLPYDFRSYISGRDEAQYVTTLKVGTYSWSDLLPFKERGQIPFWDRLFFLNASDFKL